MTGKKVFDPEEHLLPLPRKVKNQKTGQWETRIEQYLEVKWRLVWFREKYPHGTIETEEICVDLERGYARYKAIVMDGEGGKGTGYGTETATDFGDYCEKAETKSIGRALAALGIGTQFVGLDLSEEDKVVDAPALVTPSAASPRRGHPTHPTPEAINGLMELVIHGCGIDLATFGQHLRARLKLSPETKITKRWMQEHLTLEHYQAEWDHYAEILRQQHVLNGTDYEPPLDPDAEAHLESIRNEVESASEPRSGQSEGNGTAATLETPQQASRLAGIRFATEAQIANLKAEATKVGEDAEADVQDLLEHHRSGLSLEIYEVVLARLKARHPNKAAATASQGMGDG